MSITVGEKAPDFTLVSKTANGPEIIKLADYIGKTNIVLVFFPMAFTSVCTTEMCGLSNGISDYEKLDAKVFGISGDSPFAQEIWAQKENITIPLLSDYEHEVAVAYGIAYDEFLPAKNLIMGGVSKRSAFVIDKNGIIQYAEVLESPGDLPDFEAVKSTLGSL